jgi:hypothetical protein
MVKNSLPTPRDFFKVRPTQSYRLAGGPPGCIALDLSGASNEIVVRDAIANARLCQKEFVVRPDHAGYINVYPECRRLSGFGRRILAS